MTRPVDYARQADFTGYAVNHPTATYNPADHDLELNTILASLNQAIDLLNALTRDDGALQNGSVTVDTISSALYAFLTAIRQPSQYAGAWVAGVLFKFADVVTDGTVTYFCISPHTSSSLLATDVALNRWIAIGLRIGGVGGAVVLDASQLIPLAQIPVLTTAKLPTIPYSKLARFTYQTTVDFGVIPMNSMTFTVADGNATTASYITAVISSKVGDTIGDELELDPMEVSARCLVNGQIQFNVAANVGFITGQFVITYSIL